jgi:hypothetical protein
MEPNPAEAVAPKRSSPTRAPSIRYMGFECTNEGRAYRLRVEGADDPRLVTVTIPTAAFASRQARFQDAPELCYLRLQRELATNADLPDGLELVITVDEMDAYRDAQLRRSPDRKTRALRSWP